MLETMFHVIDSLLPGLSVQRFLFAVFVTNYLGGVGLMYLTYLGAKVAYREVLMRGIGLVLFVIGILWTLVTVNGLSFGAFTWALTVIVTALGQCLGVLSVILVVRPNYDPGGLSERGSRGTAERDAVSQVREVRQEELEPASQEYHELVDDTLEALGLED
jgi:hypothetical protein